MRTALTVGARTYRIVGRLAAALLVASHAGAQSRLTPAPRLPYDTLAVRALLREAAALGRAARATDRTALLAAIGRSQVAARDFASAARTLRLVEDESPAQVLRNLGETDEFASFERAGLARRLSCAWYELYQPDSALAAVRAMRAGPAREWELAHVVAMTARGDRPPYAPSTLPRVDRASQWGRALALARTITLPDARLDAYLSIARSVPDTSPDRSVLTQAYEDARKVQLPDTDRQRSRDALLVAIAARLDRHDDVRALFARLSLRDDMQYALASLARGTGKAPLVRELAPIVIRAGRAIRDSSAREAFLTSVWTDLQASGGRALANDLLPDYTARAGNRRSARAAMDSASAADASPSAVARRAAHALDFAGLRAAVQRVPLNDREATRAELWSDLAWDIYMGRRDTALVYLLEARAALVAAPRDSAAFDDRARTIAGHQFWLGANAEGVRTLNLLRDPQAARYVVSQWGSSTFSGITARKLRLYADQVTNPVLRDNVLAHLVGEYLVGAGVSESNLRWGRALADSIREPEFRQQAGRAVANDALRRGDSTDAQHRLAALLDASGRSTATTTATNALASDLLSAGGWTDVMHWGRAPSDAVTKARRLIWISGEMQRRLDVLARRPMYITNGPNWCTAGL